MRQVFSGSKVAYSIAQARKFMRTLAQNSCYTQRELRPLPTAE